MKAAGNSLRAQKPNRTKSSISFAEAVRLAREMQPKLNGFLGDGSTPWKPSRGFTVADKGLIKKLHDILPAAQLLNLLNERLVADLGANAEPYTQEQLQEVVALVGGKEATVGSLSWPDLRKLISQASRDGVLEQITEQVVNDFAVVFSLSPKQVVVLKGIVLESKE